MIKVFYTEKQNADQGEQNLPGVLKSPSARKPQQVADALKEFPGIEFVEPNPLTPDDFKLCHDPAYVDGILNLTLENGFGSKSQSVADSLPYTCGAMYDAAKAAKPNEPTCALVAGFHHAGYRGWKKLGYFCTFNGLMIAACKLLQDGMKKVAIIDCDQHWGNGTDNILKHMPHLSEKILHITFGKFFHYSTDAEEYLRWLEPNGIVHASLAIAKPEVIIYQAGADVHLDDPYGGILTTEQISKRDDMMFHLAQKLNIPIAWNLAGGYQVEEDGSIDKVIRIHLNTFKACALVTHFPLT